MSVQNFSFKGFQEPDEHPKTVLIIVNAVIMVAKYNFVQYDNDNWLYVLIFVASNILGKKLLELLWQKGMILFSKSHGVKANTNVKEKKDYSTESYFHSLKIYIMIETVLIVLEITFLNALLIRLHKSLSVPNLE